MVTAAVLLHLALGVYAVQRNSRTYDEAAHLSYGWRGLAEGTFTRSHRWDATMPVSVLQALPGWLSASRTERAGGQPPAPALVPGRFVTLGFGLLVVLAAAGLAWQAFGPTAGGAAALLAAADPNLLAHATLVTTDAATTAAFAVVAWTWWRWWTAPTPRRLATIAVALAVAQLTKATAIYLFPMLVAAGLVASRWRTRLDRAGWRLALRRALAPPLLGAVASLPILAVGFAGEGWGESLTQLAPRSQKLADWASRPLLGTLPLPLPSPYVQGFDLIARDLERERFSYCLGRYSSRGFWYYYLVAFGLKNTLGLLGSLILATVAGLRSGLRTPDGGADAARAGSHRPPSNAHAALAVCLVVITWLTVQLSVLNQYQIGLRHLLPMMPGVYVLAGASVAQACGWGRRLAWLAVAAHVGAGAASAPHHLAYFNPLAGPRTLVWRHLVDSNLDWGQADWAARAYRAEHPAVRLADRRPQAGSLLIGANQLVGLKPAQHDHYAWLRDCFEPSAAIAGGAYLRYEVGTLDLDIPCVRRAAARGRDAGAASADQSVDRDQE